MDFSMLEFHNAKERDKDGWAHLLHSADERLHIIGIKQPPGSRLSVIEVGWLPSSVATNVTNVE